MLPKARSWGDLVRRERRRGSRWPAYLHATTSYPPGTPRALWAGLSHPGKCRSLIRIKQCTTQIAFPSHSHASLIWVGVAPNTAKKYSNYLIKIALLIREDPTLCIIHYNSGSQPGWFCDREQRSFWRNFWLSQQEQGLACCWNLVGREARDAVKYPTSAQDGPTTKNDLAQSDNSAHLRNPAF